MRDAEPRRRFYNSVPAQALVALTFNIVSLFAGGIITLLSPQIKTDPWILALFPPILTIRGDISGIFSGNLTTMLHLGMIRPKIRGNTEIYRRLVTTVFVITFIDTLAMGFISFTLNILFNRASLEQLLLFIYVPTISCVMAVILTLPLTSMVAIATFRKGLDPDILVYPILSSVNDIVVTTSFVATVALLSIRKNIPFLLEAVFFGITVLCLLLAWRNRHNEFFSKTLREGATVVTLSSLFGSINGIFLASLRNNLLLNPGIVVLYPSLMSGLGSIGSIVGSVTTTSLALGYSRSFREEVQAGLKGIFQVEIVAMLMHIVFGFIAYFIVKPASGLKGLNFLLGVAIISNLFSFIVISLFALIVAFHTFKRGLNPDNVVIPAIASTSDTVATLSMLTAITLIKIILAQS